MQMGYGRGGWYSYDAMDMQGASAFQVLPELQDLKVGDVVPTYPGGGFVVSALEPNRALVLYLDTDLVREQAEAARPRDPRRARRTSGPPGALMENAQPAEFSASWAFVLEELPAVRRGSSSGSACGSARPTSRGPATPCRSWALACS